MSTKLSILWEIERGTVSRETREAGKKVITDLQLDRSFRTVCTDTLIREAFLDVLITPLDNIDEIKNRIEVTKDFVRVPQLLDRLIELVRRLTTIKNGWDSERSRIIQGQRVNPHEKSSVLWQARELLILTSHFIRTATMHISDIHESLNMFGCINGWLGRLKDASYMMSESKQALYILNYAEKLEKGLGSAHTYDVEFSLDAEMFASPYFLRDFKYAVIHERVPKKQKSAITSLFESLKKADKDKPANQNQRSVLPDEPEINTARIEGIDSDWSFEISAKAVRECDRYLTSYLRTVIDRFSALENELYFYKAVLMYMKRFDDRSVRYVYPEFRPASDNLLDIRGLSDLLLLTESMSVLSVVPNDVYFENNSIGTDSKAEAAGILITGKNNSGKTVYLRSVGCAVVLAQCGLPVPCESAVISIRNRVFTSFAAAEGELVSGSSVGRFEEEVVAVSRVIDEIVPSSLLLLNETFQTTAYDEGAEGMYHILNYISSLGCGFIFVTHLTKLRELYSENSRIGILKTSDSPETRYKLTSIK